VKAARVTISPAGFRNPTATSRPLPETLARALGDARTPDLAHAQINPVRFQI
jgi:hypothetical protein